MARGTRRVPSGEDGEGAKMIGAGALRHKRPGGEPVWRTINADTAADTAAGTAARVATRRPGWTARHITPRLPPRTVLSPANNVSTRSCVRAPPGAAVACQVSRAVGRGARAGG